MSTPPEPGAVKRALLEKLRQEVFPALEQLVSELPDGLGDAAQAERQVRRGALAAARSLLAAWGQAADPAVPRPDCPRCRLPMRHKGYKSGSALTTVGAVAFRRARFRCAGCGGGGYPPHAPPP